MTGMVKRVSSVNLIKANDFKKENVSFFKILTFFHMFVVTI
jgi:hypothetical protein